LKSALTEDERGDNLLQRIQIKMTAQGRGIPSFQWGSILHGVLMQKLNPDYVEYLHNSSGLKPLSQYVLPLQRHRIPEEGDFVWTIHLMGEEAIQEIRPILEKEKEYYLEHKDVHLDVIETKSYDPISEEDFCSRYLLDEHASHSPKIRYITPCSHKSAGQYCLFPSIDLILNSLVQKWNAYAKSYTLADEQAFEDMIQRTRIRNYQLRSAQYHLEGIRIPAYMGGLGFSIKGPDPLIRLVNMLLGYAEYSGIGIKTSLGMGACLYER
jgi:CRISPR-associated endoribonuclease Cas6